MSNVNNSIVCGSVDCKHHRGVRGCSLGEIHVGGAMSSINVTGSSTRIPTCENYEPR